jgi:hypothetical protein
MRRYWKKGVSSESMNPHQGKKITPRWKIKWGVFRGLTAVGEGGDVDPAIASVYGAGRI